MITAEMTTNGSLFYPVFRPNQVLTDNHLNDAVSYLEAQTRLTRATLIGTGIICGFQPSIDTANTALAVTAGCGVTTEGYLLVGEACTLTHYRRATLEEGDFPGLDGSEAIHELYTSAIPQGVREDPENPIVALTESQDDAGSALWPSLPGKVVVLLLHIEDEERDICLYDCDEAGARRSFHLRKLVMDVADAEAIIRAGYGLADGADLDRTFNRSYYLPEVTLKRFGYVKQGGDGPDDASAIDLAGITSLTAYLEAYDRLCGENAAGNDGNSLYEALAEAYARSNELFSPFFAGTPPDSVSDFDGLQDELMKQFDAVRELGVQYFYDYLKDLILAYGELRDATFDLMDDCMPSAGRYPRHLMLGVVPASASCPPSVLRTPFTQPPIYNGNARRLQAVHSLYQRMLALATGFGIPDVGDETSIKITPSRLAPVPMGARAIPFYYDPSSDLYQSWDFERSRRCKAGQNNSYHPLPQPDGTEGPVENPLLCDIDAYDFYRIEGHVGHTYEDALRRVQALRAQYNLAFDVIALKISLVADIDNIQYNYVFEDLEAAYSTCKEELLCVLAELPNHNPPSDVSDAITSLNEGLTTAPNGDDTIQDEFLFGDYYNLRRLSQDDHFTNFSQEHQTVFSWVTSEPLPFFDCCPQTAQLLLDAYAERVAEVQQQLLFHIYAQRHPGVEHLAGVPRGGTFILAYVNEGEEDLLKEIERQMLEQAGGANDKERILLLGDSTGAIQKALQEAREASRKGVDAFKIQGGEALKELEAAREIVAKFGGSEEAVATIEELLAAEMASRTNTVVGDFCLPYRCCGDAPGFSFVVAQPRPIVLLEEVSYCVTDPGPYEFVLHPPNGLLEGPGVDSSSGSYQFRPNDQEVVDLVESGETFITFTYTADGGTDTLTVEILPPRDAGFTDLPETICIVPSDPDNPANDRIELVPNIPGGTFTPAGAPLEEENGSIFFNPLAATPGQPVDITYTVPVGDDGCAHSETQAVTVLEGPDPAFTIGPDDTTTFCSTDPPVVLTPVAQGLESSFGGIGVQPDETFDPSQVGLNEGDASIAVDIFHEVGDPVTKCKNTLTRTVTVFAQPDAGFTGPGADLFCVSGSFSEGEEIDIAPTPQPLNPATPGGAFRISYTIGGVDVQEDVTDLQLALEGLATALSENEDSVVVTLEYAVGVGDCSSSSEKTFRIALRPVALFTFGPVCVDQENPQTLPLTPDQLATPGGVFSDNQGVVIPGNQQGEFFFNTGGVNFGDIPTTTVEVTYDVSRDYPEGSCSDSFTFSVEVLLVPDARFDAAVGQVTEAQLPIVIFDIKPPHGEAYIWKDNIHTDPVERNDIDDFELVFDWNEVEASGQTQLDITLEVRRGPCSGFFAAPPIPIPERPGDGGVIIDTTNEGGEPLGSGALDLLNDRTVGRQDTLTTLAADNANLDGTLSFSRTIDLVELDATTPASAVVTQFENVIGTVVPVLKAATDPARQKAFAQLIELAVHSLFDKLAVNEPTAAEEAVIAAQIEKIKETEVDLGAIRDNWQGDDLRDAFPDKRVDKSFERLG